MKIIVPFLLLNSVLTAQVLVAPQPGNQVVPSVSVTVAQDPKSGLYTYSYTVSSAAISAEEIWFVSLELGGDAAQGIVNTTAPKGWTFSKNPQDPGVTWVATQVDTVPAGFVDDGSVIPSPYQIKPGQALAGFSFQSPQPPTVVRFYAQGFTQMPSAVDAGDLDDAGYVLKDYVDDSIIGVTQAPTPTNASSQPSGLGFFNFLQLTNGAVRQSPVTVGVHFNVGAATIDTTSFHAELNGQDVTSHFTPTGSGSDLSATFNTPGSPLISGTDVLQGMVSGTPTGGTSSETDLNYIRFYVNTTRPLDLNGDGVVNCLDLAIVKASFGKKTGQTGFDPRADVNGDGAVNVLDLAAVSQQVAYLSPCNSQ
jgi:hypothetical protein